MYTNCKLWGYQIWIEFVYISLDHPSKGESPPLDG
jgi:hypothetical protein